MDIFLRISVGSGLFLVQRVSNHVSRTSEFKAIRVKYAVLVAKTPQLARRLCCRLRITHRKSDGLQGSAGDCNCHRYSQSTSTTTAVWWKKEWNRVIKTPILLRFSGSQMERLQMPSGERVDIRG